MKNEKTKYVVPQIEVIAFQTADIITTSAGFNGDEHDLSPMSDDELLW